MLAHSRSRGRQLGCGPVRVCDMKMSEDNPPGVTWSAHRTVLRAGASEKVVITARGRPLSFAEVIDGWRHSAAFRDFFMAMLAATDYPAYFWETPPIVHGSTGVPYEHVVIRSDALAGLPPEPDAFEEKFVSTGRGVASFRNLGGDALLIAPRPLAAWSAYGHLAAFVRGAPEGQRHELFQTLARALRHVLRICDGRLWTSTAGLGVPWLHLRIDSFPKYYNHAPYRGG